MRNYELMYIVKPTLDEETRTNLVEELQAILTKNNAEIVKVDEWGLRDLAYEINDFSKGYYVVTKFQSDNQAVDEFKRLVSMNRNVMRHMIVRLDD